MSKIYKQITRYVVEIAQEAKSVDWIKKEMILPITVRILILSVVVMSLVVLIDFIISKIVYWITTL